MRKRVIGLFLVATMGISLLAGCGAKKYTPELPTEKVESEIFVQQIDNLPEDFIKGMDISSVISEEESGVKYYNEAGEEEDLFKILADSGINYIRVRVWNNPYDENGNGYGGGNCDVDKAVAIGKRAADYGMKLLVDFHYSDFWADPAKQYMPVEWRNTTTDEKRQLLYDFTVESLTKIIEGGADVGMVQIGNEINNGMSSEYKPDGIMGLLEKASAAVRKVATDKKKDIKIAVHYTEIDDVDGTFKHAKELADYNIDYDIFGVSYYPFWHGTMENMTEVLSSIKEQYGKETCVLETSYCYTGDDGDNFGNSVAAGDCLEEYPASVQGQATCIRDIMAAANTAEALGVFYWEGAWVPVGSDFTTNQELWEKYGSGWASSFSASYDKKDAGKYYGGCSWDNQAMFDFHGKALPSLNVFKYVNYGSTSELEILSFKELIVESQLHQPVQMPDTIEAIYNDPSETAGVAVTWDPDSLAKVDVDTVADYKVNGHTDDGKSVWATVKVANTNFVKNASFEDEDTSMWSVNYISGSNYTDIQNKPADATSGNNAFHFYNESEQEFYVEQTLTGLTEGKYSFTANLQGGDVGSNAKVYIYVNIGDETYISDDVTLDGWVKWKNPIISNIPVDGTTDVVVGFYIKCASKGWGTVDDLQFYNQE